MKLRLFGPGGRVWRLAFRIKHTAKSLKYRQLYNCLLYTSDAADEL